jgi:hypothetical protein
LEEEAALDLIPAALVDDGRGRMRCDDDRCLALVGEVGVATACSIYAVRPEVCRACLPGDDACQMARRRFGLAPGEPATAAGCTAHEIASITGHASLEQVAPYTKAVDQGRLASAAMEKVKARTSVANLTQG